MPHLSADQIHQIYFFLPALVTSASLALSLLICGTIIHIIVWSKGFIPSSPQKTGAQFNFIGAKLDTYWSQMRIKPDVIGLSLVKASFDINDTALVSSNPIPNDQHLDCPRLLDALQVSALKSRWFQNPNNRQNKGSLHQSNIIRYCEIHSKYNKSDSVKL